VDRQRFLTDDICYRDDVYLRNLHCRLRRHVTPPGPYRYLPPRYSCSETFDASQTPHRADSSRIPHLPHAYHTTTVVPVPVPVADVVAYVVGLPTTPHRQIYLPRTATAVTWRFPTDSYPWCLRNNATALLLQQAPLPLAVDSDFDSRLAGRLQADAYGPCHAFVYALIMRAQN